MPGWGAFAPGGRESAPAPGSVGVAYDSTARCACKPRPAGRSLTRRGSRTGPRLRLGFRRPAPRGATARSPTPPGRRRRPMPSEQEPRLAEQIAALHDTVAELADALR